MLATLSCGRRHHCGCRARHTHGHPLYACQVWGALRFPVSRLLLRRCCCLGIPGGVRVCQAGEPPGRARQPPVRSARLHRHQWRTEGAGRRHGQPVWSAPVPGSPPSTSTGCPRQPGRQRGTVCSAQGLQEGRLAEDALRADGSRSRPPGAAVARRRLRDLRPLAGAGRCSPRREQHQLGAVCFVAAPHGSRGALRLRGLRAGRAPRLRSAASAA
mmetsp:Transcript_51696/g.154471  ORF Transcript_51696/g.154471 Transcript_51696/m.154471 type:complete len:215 (-) Transcript_51696:23-667(-)